MSAAATWFWDDVYPIDAVVVKEQRESPPQTAGSRPNSIEALEHALMIRGKAARYLEKLLFN